VNRAPASSPPSGGKKGVEVFQQNRFKNRMVDFSYEIINQIKAASDRKQVTLIIERSLETLAGKNGIFSSKRRYMMNMVMALRYVKAEGLNTKASANVNHAIEVFEALRKRSYSHLF
jgi:hypothetical protein